MPELKAASTFTGQPDPLRGMEPYKALHDQAHTTIEQVASRVNGGSRKPQNGLFNTIKTTGNAPVARGAHVGPARGVVQPVAPKTMTGMGNTTPVQQQPGNSWQNKAQNLGRQTLNVVTPRVQPSQGQVVSDQTSSSNTNYVPKPVGPRGMKPGQQPVAPVSQYKAPNGTFAITQKSVNSGKANTDGTYERGLVNELCAAGGMKPVPPADKLEIFVRNCRNISADVIAPLVLAKLSEDNYQVELKALCVIEALIKQEGCEDYLEYFKENQEEIAELGIKGNKAVMKKADNLLSLIERGGEDEVEEEEPEDVPPPPRRTQPVQQELPPPEEEPMDLMAGGDAGGDDLFSIVQEQPAPAAPEVDSGNMFDGLTTETINQSVTENFDFNVIPPTNVAAAPASDPFGDIDFGGATSMTMNTNPAPSSHMSAMSESSGGADAFGYFDNVKPAGGRKTRGSSANIDLNSIPSYTPQQNMGYGPPPGQYGMNPGMPPPGQYGINPGMPPQGMTGGYGMNQQPGGYNMPPQGMPPPGQYGMNPGMPPQGMGYGMPPQGGMGYGMQQGMPPQGMGYGMNPGMGMPPQQQAPPPKQPDQFANLLPDF